MNRLKTMVVVVMLTLWVPLTMHCQLESIPVLKFLACCVHPDSAPHQDNDCEQDGCAVVESGLYKVEEPTVVQPAPVCTPAVVLALLAELHPAGPRFTAAFGSAPPELPRVWQFSCRTALPPRAPSFVS